MKSPLLSFFSSTPWFVFLIALYGSCTAEDPIIKSATPYLKAIIATSSHTALNNCSFTSGGSNGTTFTFNFVYDASGDFTITKLEGTYTWSDGTTGPASLPFADTPTAGGFRSAGRSGALVVSDRCIRFGSTSYIEYNLKITTSTQLQSSIVLRVTKPAGAN